MFIVKPSKEAPYFRGSLIQIKGREAVLCTRPCPREGRDSPEPQVTVNQISRIAQSHRRRIWTDLCTRADTAMKVMMPLCAVTIRQAAADADALTIGLLYEDGHCQITSNAAEKASAN